MTPSKTSTVTIHRSSQELIRTLTLRQMQRDVTQAAPQRDYVEAALRLAVACPEFDQVFDEVVKES